MSKHTTKKFWKKIDFSRFFLIGIAFLLFAQVIWGHVRMTKLNSKANRANRSIPKTDLSLYEYKGPTLTPTPRQLEAEESVQDEEILPEKMSDPEFRKDFYKAAKKAGKSDEEIYEYINQQLSLYYTIKYGEDYTNQPSVQKNDNNESHRIQEGLGNEQEDIFNSFCEREIAEYEDCMRKYQEEMNEYNSCKSEYAAKMGDYNECLIEQQNEKFGFPGSCYKPSNLCFKPYDTCIKPTCY